MVLELDSQLGWLRSRRAVAVLGLLLLWEAAGLALRARTLAAPARSHVAAPSVPTFGYDAMRSGAVPSPLRADGPGRFHEIPFPWGSDANEHPPLYVNGTRDPVPGALGRHLLIFGARGSRIVAVDLDERRAAWSLALGRGEVQSTPVVDLERGILYFLTIDIAPPGPGEAIFPRNGHALHAVRLDGTGLRSREVDLRRLLGQPPDAAPPSWSHYAFCKTALTLYEDAGAHSLLQGCSVAPRYGEVRGVRGLLLAVDLDDAGWFREPASLRTFSPTPPTDDPRTGYDAGIWNAGSGPTVLPDGAVLVAVGNGLLLPEEESYGCSVIRLDGATLRPRAVVSGDPVFYSVDSLDSNECWALNRDLGSSAVAAVEADGRIVAAVAGKDARLRVFDPDALPGADPDRRVEVEGVGKRGQPAILRDAAGRVRVFAAGRQIDQTLATEYWIAPEGEAPASGDAEVRHLACLGWAPDPAPGAPSLDRHYSGRLRRDSVVLPSSSISAGRIRSFRNEFGLESISLGGTRLWSPYARTARIGGAPAAAARAAPAGFAWRGWNVYFHAERGGLFSLPADFAERGGALAQELLAGAVLVERTDAMLLVAAAASGADGCGDAPLPGHRRLELYELRDRGPRANGWVVASFDVARGPGLGLERRWEHRGDMAYRPHIASPSLTIDPDGMAGLVFFTVHERDDATASRLLVFDAGDGRLIDRAFFVGTPHFSMPLVVGERVYVATSLHGLKVFERSQPLLDLVRATPVWRALRGLGLAGGG